jgi:hypothetical protein
MRGFFTAKLYSDRQKMTSFRFNWTVLTVAVVVACFSPVPLTDHSEHPDSSLWLV